MREKIDLFLPCEYIGDAQNALSVLHEYKTVQHIHFLVSADFAAHHQVPEGCTFVITDRLESSNTIVSIAENTDADYVMICTRHTTIGWGNNTLERFLRVADDTDARRLQTSSADGHPEPKTTHQATFHAYARRCRYRQPTSRTWRIKRPCVPLQLPFLR